ncbi:MAG TPA: ornithine cyclodeaminase family protein [Chloroflexota bacterium]|jgi:ornithine cyclodeaminase/alanine dehydrogenase-like protein (mu-crystallin family)|nr:ornithine cyclodeaminase family protein [Chloroflexota bacterium]
MAGLLVLSQDEVKSLLDLDRLRTAVAEALSQSSGGTCSIPPRIAAFTGAGLLAAMPGYLPDSTLAVKLVSVFPHNHTHGLPSHQGMIVLFDPETGSPLALMDGTYITAVRTAAASAVAAETLARPDSRVIAILGAGVQGATHLEALSRVFGFQEIRIASRHTEHAHALANGHDVAHAVSFEEAVRSADIICCCTDARDPVIQRDWVRAGAHVGSVGTGAEIDPQTIAGGSIFVEWRGAVKNPPPAGAIELQGMDSDTVTEIGEVLNGTRPGRTSPEQITVYKSTGHAVEDAAAAGLVYDAATRASIGATITI